MQIEVGLLYFIWHLDLQEIFADNWMAESPVFIKTPSLHWPTPIGGPRMCGNHLCSVCLQAGELLRNKDCAWPPTASWWHLIQRVLVAMSTFCFILFLMFIVVQGQLSPFFPHHAPHPTHPHLPPSNLPHLAKQCGIMSVLVKTSIPGAVICPHGKSSSASSQLALHHKGHIQMQDHKGFINTCGFAN